MSAIIDLFEITIGNCKFMQLMIFCKYICVHDFGLSTNSILLEIDILVCHAIYINVYFRHKVHMLHIENLYIQCYNK